VGNEFGVKGGVTGQYHAVGDGELKCVGGLVDGEFEVKSGVIGQPHVIGGQVIVLSQRTTCHRITLRYV
jgi:hypothetical protein